MWCFPTGCLWCSLGPTIYVEMSWCLWVSTLQCHCFSRGSSLQNTRVHRHQRIVFDGVSLVHLGKSFNVDPKCCIVMTWKWRRGSTNMTWGTSKYEVGDNWAIQTIYVEKHMTVYLTFSAWEAFIFGIGDFLYSYVIVPFIPLRQCRRYIEDRQFLFPMLTIYISDFGDADNTSMIFRELFSQAIIIDWHATLL